VAVPPSFGVARFSGEKNLPGTAGKKSGIEPGVQNIEIACDLVAESRAPGGLSATDYQP
jgi:hypothetical protein